MYFSSVTPSVKVIIVIITCTAIVPRGPGQG